MLKDGTAYQDLGKDYFLKRDREQTTNRAIRSLEKLGFKVTLENALSAMTGSVWIFSEQYE